MTATTPTVPRSAMTSECRADNHKACEIWGKRCACPCHGPGGQVPKSEAARQQRRDQNRRPPSEAHTDRAAEPADTAAPTGPPPSPDDDLIWGLPPEGKRGPTASLVSAQHQAALKARPGEWARVRTYKAKSTAGGCALRIRKGALGPGWEATARRLPDGGSALWLRWVGDQ